MPKKMFLPLIVIGWLLTLVVFNVTARSVNNQQQKEATHLITDSTISTTPDGTPIKEVTRDQIREGLWINYTVNRDVNCVMMVDHSFRRREIRNGQEHQLAWALPLSSSMIIPSFGSTNRRVSYFLDTDTVFHSKNVPDGDYTIYRVAQYDCDGYRIKPLHTQVSFKING